MIIPVIVVFVMIPVLPILAGIVPPILPVFAGILSIALPVFAGVLSVAFQSSRVWSRSRLGSCDGLRPPLS
jgi:hypothetical protein